MLDPKSLDVLAGTFGGVRGLLRGLGVRAGVGVGSGVGAKGLGGGKEGLGEGDGRPGAGTGASHRHDPEKRTHVKEKDKASMDIPGIVVTSADHDHDATYLHDHPSPPDDEDDDDFSEAYTASLETRREIYGHNVLPIRKSKGLFALMWAALKDKVLVRRLPVLFSLLFLDFPLPTYFYTPSTPLCRMNSYTDTNFTLPFPTPLRYPRRSY